MFDVKFECLGLWRILKINGETHFAFKGLVLALVVTQENNGLWVIRVTLEGGVNAQLEYDSYLKCKRVMDVLLSNL